MDSKGKAFFIVSIGCGSIIGGLICATILIFLIGGLAIESGFIPDSAALPRGKIPPRQISQLKAMKIVDQDEEVFFFYSAAFLSIKDEGNLFTDRRVISYQDNEGKLDIYSAYYPDIAAIDFHKSEFWEEDSSITVTKDDGDWFLLVVDPESGRDVVFYEKLKDLWIRQKKDKKDNQGKGSTEAAAPSP